MYHKLCNKRIICALALLLLFFFSCVPAFSLTKESRNFIKKIEKPVHFLFFTKHTDIKKESNAFQKAMALSKQFTALSKKVSTKVVLHGKNKKLEKKYAVKNFPSLVITANKSKKTFSLKNIIEEKEIIPAIKKLLRPSALQVMKKVSALVWGLPLIILLLGTGLYLTIRLRGIQFRGLFHALKLAFIVREEKGGEGDINHFQALMTALAATVGTGNVVGVATAIAMGGPGALFWMWMTGLLGMATKYAEAVLAVKYRVKDEKGEMCGGPMYYISNGLKKKWLGVLFAIFAAIAAFGIGNLVQSNAVAAAVNSSLGIPPIVIGIVVTLLTGLVIIGGIKEIGKVTGILVPFMIIAYVVGGIIIILLNLEKVPGAFKLIMQGAFSPLSAAGGAIGFTVMKAINKGVSRGIFSNESGMGSAPIAAAAAKTSHPVSQALVSMTQTFIDTIIVCSITGLIIVMSGAWTNKQLTGLLLTNSAFNWGFKGGQYLVSFGIVFFAFSTILGWYYYGERSVHFLMGRKAIMPYKFIWVAVVFIGAIAKLDFVWTFSDIMNGLMAFPNLVGLIGLASIITFETKNYFSEKKRKQL